MEKVKVELELPKEVYELGQGLKKVVAAAAKAAEDGWQTGEDLPSVLVSVVAELPAMVGGLDQLDDEWKEDGKGVVQAVALAVSDVAFSLVKKEEKPEGE